MLLSEESGRTSIGTSDLKSSLIPIVYFEDGRNSGIVISNVGSAKGEEISFKVTFPKEENNEKFTSIIGTDRYDTAAKLSNLNFISADTVILVNGLALADGLAVSPLAAHMNSPILLIRKNSIPQETIDEIKRLGAKNALLVGGENV